MTIRCEDCKIRKWYARLFDVHFDYKDCPVKSGVCEEPKEETDEESL